MTRRDRIRRLLAVESAGEAFCLVFTLVFFAAFIVLHHLI